jgi:cytidine deaminase
MADDSVEALFEAAAAARTSAYAPYSGFAVGAALLAPSGRIYSGCNVENAAYPVGTCAEAGALSALVAAGERRILAAAIVGSGDRPCPPCGACRQRLAEFAAPETPVYYSNQGLSDRRTGRVGDLLPSTFSAESLKETGS